VVAVVDFPVVVVAAAAVAVGDFQVVQ